MVWICGEKELWIWASRQEKRKPTKKIHGCSERGHAEDRIGWQRWGEMKANDPLWQPLKSAAESRNV